MDGFNAILFANSFIKTESSYAVHMFLYRSSYKHIFPILVGTTLVSVILSKDLKSQNFS